MHTVAGALGRYEPDSVQWVVSLAEATRRTDSINAAQAILLGAVERHPDAAILHYKLACYECQLAELENAKARLKHAFKLEPGFRAVMLDEKDLEPLWGSFD